MRGEGGGEKGEREIRTFWDDIREEALREGLQQGLQQGLLLSAQEMVLEALEERVGRVEEDIMEKVRTINNRDFKENTQANDSHKFA